MCDVLVCVMSSSYSIKECIQVVRNLWVNNIKADVLYDASMVRQREGGGGGERWCCSDLDCITFCCTVLVCL